MDDVNSQRPTPNSQGSRSNVGVEGAPTLVATAFTPLFERPPWELGVGRWELEMTPLNRREFILTGAAAGVAAAADAQTSGAPAVARGGIRPVVLSSANGHHYKNGGTQTC